MQTINQNLGDWPSQDSTILVFLLGEILGCGVDVWVCVGRRAWSAFVQPRTVEPVLYMNVYIWMSWKGYPTCIWTWITRTILKFATNRPTQRPKKESMHSNSESFERSRYSHNGQVWIKSLVTPPPQKSQIKIQIQDLWSFFLFFLCLLAYLMLVSTIHLRLLPICGWWWWWGISKSLTPCLIEDKFSRVLKKLVGWENT